MNPSTSPNAPRLTGPAIFGCRPGSPILHGLTAVAADSVTFEADRLPPGVHLDAKSGRLTGSLREPGRHLIRVAALSKAGRAERDFQLVCGSRLALTPPMGWSSWNCWGEAVSADKVLASARAIAGDGLAAHGWSYVNVDDAWQGERSRAEGHALQPNEKFPDLGGMVEEIHGLGLRAGIYSSPWSVTYAGFRGDSSDDPSGRWFDPLPGDWPRRRARLFNSKGAHSFTVADARQFARWGFDYLKYDWFPIDGATARQCAAALRATGRDILLSLSNTLAVSTIPEVLGSAQLWRTTNDLLDRWNLNARTPFSYQGIRDVIRWHEAFQPFQSPGAWNDPDMLVLGRVGLSGALHASGLIPDEQTTHFALWCLWSAPLLIGCPVEQLDPHTRALLTNADLIDLDQDEAGLQAVAKPLPSHPEHFAYFKQLANGDAAVGLFNFDESPATLEADFLTLAERTEPVQYVLDCLTGRYLGEVRDRIGAEVPPHGCAVFRLAHPTQSNSIS